MVHSKQCSQQNTRMTRISPTPSAHTSSTPFTHISSLRHPSLLSLLLGLLLLSLDSFTSFGPVTLVVHGHYAAPSVKDLSIHSVDSGSATVTLADRRSKKGSAGPPLAECTFTYTTNEFGAKPQPPAPVVEEKPKENKVNVKDVLQTLDGACVTSTSDYWSYEFCVNRYFKQFRGGDVYHLGRTGPNSMQVLADGQSILMEGGDICQAITPPKPRQVKVNFACRANAASPQITQISETATCVYQIQVATALVCRDPSYPVLANDWQPPAGGRSEGPLETGSEDWFLELSELESNEDGQSEPILMCQAYSLEYRATSVKSLKFAKFEMKITKLSGDTKGHRSNIDELPREYQTPIARKPSRVPVADENLQASYGDVQLKATTTSDYDGSLSLVKVYA